MSFFLSADMNANPNYARCFENNFSSVQIKKIINGMTSKDRVLYTDKLAEKYRLENSVIVED